MRELAAQTCPWFRKLPVISPSITHDGSASFRTMAGFLPPSSRVTPIRRSAAERAICLPVAVEPVKLTLAICGWLVSAAPHTAPLPVTTLKTPSGIPASLASSATRSRVSGVVSDGLITIEQPAARAGITFHMPISSGKFHGTIPATTPIGSLRVHA